MQLLFKLFSFVHSSLAVLDFFSGQQKNIVYLTDYLSLHIKKRGQSTAVIKTFINLSYIHTFSSRRCRWRFMQFRTADKFFNLSSRTVQPVFRVLNALFSLNIHQINDKALEVYTKLTQRKIKGTRKPLKHSKIIQTVTFFFSSLQKKQ